MMTDVFRGIGGTAWKLYLLFQHHLPPPSSTYTTGKDLIYVRVAPYHRGAKEKVYSPLTLVA